MQQMRTIFGVLTITTLFLFETCAGTRNQVNEVHKSSKTRGTRLELTEVDVLARHDWSSEDVAVLGFHLGMKRAEAMENARERKLTLMATTHQDTSPCSVSHCDVCDEKVICNGIGLEFDSGESVDAINIVRTEPDFSSEVRNASIVRHFKGRTYSFFHNYSNELRLKLLGSESKREENASVKYLYPKFGVQVYVSHSPNRGVPEGSAGLTVSFVHPNDN